jgi:hypothetical protein
MALRIKDATKDLPLLNNELQRLDKHQQQISTLTTQLGQIRKQFLNSQSEVAPENHLGQNNVIVIWSGGTLTATWNNSYTRSNGRYLPIVNGSQVLVASTYYWVGWNPTHLTMSFQPDIHALVNIPSEIILGQIFTGTAIQSGNAGMGGTEPGGHGINGKQYKAF